MLIQVQRNNELDQVHIFQYIYFYSFQVYQQVIMYRFEQTNRGNHLGFLTLII